MEPSPCQRRRGSAFVWTAKNWRNTAKCTGVLVLIPTIAIRCGLPGLRQFQTIAGLIPRTASIRKSLTSRHRTRRSLSGDALNLSLKDSRSGRVRVQPLPALRQSVRGVLWIVWGTPWCEEIVIKCYSGIAANGLNSDSVPAALIAKLMTNSRDLRSLLSHV